MTSLRLLLASCTLLGFCQLTHAADKFFGQDLIDVKITLPNGDTYVRGESDPVNNLLVNVVLTNKTAKENLNKETVTIEGAERLTGDEYVKLHSMTREEQVKLLDAKKVSKTIESYPINKDSLGYGYVEPKLGPHDFVDVVITKVPEEGQPAPEKPVLIPRDNKPDKASFIDMQPTQYVAAGTSTEPITLPVGKYYLIQEPGKYTVKVILRNMSDTEKSTRYAESNEETFRVLPFKVVNQKIDYLRDSWEQYERGTPHFNYMIYQVKTANEYDEIWCVQRIPIRKFDKFEWTRVCTVKDGFVAQLAQLSPTKVKIAAVQEKGDLGLYELDFTNPGVKIKSESKEIKNGAVPKLGADGALTE